MHNMLKFYSTRDFKANQDKIVSVDIKSFLEKDWAYYRPFVINEDLTEAKYVNGEEPELFGNLTLTPTSKNTEYKGNTSISVSGTIRVSAAYSTPPDDPNLDSTVGIQHDGGGKNIRVWSLDRRTYLWQDNQGYIGGRGHGSLDYGVSSTIPVDYTATLKEIKLTNISFTKWSPENEYFRVVKRGNSGGHKQIYKTLYTWPEDVIGPDGKKMQVFYSRAVYFKVSVEPCYIYAGDNFKSAITEQAKAVASNSNNYNITAGVSPATGTVTFSLPGSGEGAPASNPTGTYTVTVQTETSKQEGSSAAGNKDVILGSNPEISLSLSVKTGAGSSGSFTVPTGNSNNNHCGGTFALGGHTVTYTVN